METTALLLPARGDPSRLTADDRALRHRFPAALVAMPWADQRPQIQLGLLAAIGRSHGFPVDTHHLFLDLPPLVEPEEVARLLEFAPVLDWLFSVAAFGDDVDPTDRLLEDLNQPDRTALAGLGFGRERLRALRHDLLPAWVDRLGSDTDWGRYRFVGFSSNLYQNAASFALARRIKDGWPAVRICFGGANFQDPMGRAWMSALPFIDLAVAGEGDRAFPALLAALTDGRPLRRLPGVISRAEAGQLVGPRPNPPFHQLDSLPVPDYDEFFSRAGRRGLDRARLAGGLYFEASRGCWWGQKSHCTFCGLDDKLMPYRSKSPERVRAELHELSTRYGETRLAATDWIIDRGHQTAVLDQLAADGAPYRLFFEIKANLGREDVLRLRRAGMDSMQPGIESLHSYVLGLMRKGVRAPVNVNLLRWTTHYGILTVWNILWGFPGEKLEHIAEQAALLPDLVHLQSPMGANRITIDRYSPIYEDQKRYPIRHRRPAWYYHHATPPHVDLADAAYRFQGEIVDAQPDAAYRPLEAAVQYWRDARARNPQPSLTAHFAADRAEITDGRGVSTAHILLTPAATTVYRACFDRPVAVRTATAEVVEQHGAATAESALAELTENRLVMREGNVLLALALPAVIARKLRRNRPDTKHQLRR